MSIDLSKAMAEAGVQLERVLDRLLPKPQAGEPPLADAIRYASLGGGKRLRPFLVVSSARLFGVAESCALRVGAAVEMIHCYSLVHDDLPAMDNDDLRRGKPTTHKAYDEATAILAGDALLTQAFEVLADSETHADPKVRIALVAALARAAGAAGMVGGQALDMQAEQTPLTEIGAITRLQRLKTGALFEFSCEAGAILGKVEDARRGALQAYAHDMGLAFQIADDLLDYVSDSETLGKNIGDDLAEGKPTLPLIYAMQAADEEQLKSLRHAIEHGGLDSLDRIVAAIRDSGALERTHEKAVAHAAAAREALADLAPSPFRDALAALADYSVERRF